MNTIQLPDGPGYHGGAPHLSPSSVTMFLRCPEQWRRRYLHNEKRPPAAALIRGKADHHAHELNYRQKIESHTDLPVDDVLDAFDQSWREQVDAAGGQSNIETTDDLAKTKDVGYKAVKEYHSVISPSILPVTVEQEGEKEIGGVLVIAKADVITEDFGVERKTTAKKKTQPDSSHVIQARTYDSIFDKRFSLHYVANSAAITTFAISPHPSLDIIYNRAALSINSYYDTYGPDETWPGATTHQWACGFCGYSGTCAYWGPPHA